MLCYTMSMRPITERFNIFTFATRVFYRVYDELHDWYFTTFHPDEISRSARMREVDGLLPCNPVPCGNPRPAVSGNPEPFTKLREVVDTAYGGTDTVTLPLDLFLALQHQVLTGDLLGISNKATDLIRGVTFASEHAPDIDRPVDDGCLKHGCALHLARNLDSNEVAVAGVYEPFVESFTEVTHKGECEIGKCDKSR